MDKTYGSLKEVTDLLDSEGKAVLMIWDGLDKAVGQGSLTGHLLGQMRDIFHGKRHKIVTAARKTQSELARNKQVYDSEFWNLFDPNPVRVETFTDLDVEAALAKAELILATGGKQELLNWSGGYPPLLLAVLNKLIAKGHGGPFTNDDVSDAAQGALDDIGEMLTTLWEKDFTAGVKDVYRLLTERQELLASDIGTEETKCLVSGGFAVRAGNKVRPACRMLQVRVQGIMPDAGSMARLFGTWTAYRSGIRDVLELRLKQIPTVNKLLRRLVERSIEDIPEFPDACLNCLSQIEDLALDLIWEGECGASKQVPNDVVAYWTVAPRDKDKVIAERMNSNDWSIPSERWKQLGLLQTLTGSRIGFDDKAKNVSKDTYVLVNAIHSFRNRSEHPEGQAIHEGVAVAAMMACLELLACLARELT